MDKVTGELSTDKLREIAKTLEGMYRSENSVRKHHPELYQHLTDTYPQCSSFTEKLYRFINNIIEDPKCPTCGKPVKFRNIYFGYNGHCCNACANKDPKTKELSAQTRIDKYGSVSYNNHEKAMKTCMERYGATSYSKTDEYKQYLKDHYDEIQEKSVNTYMEKYGVSNFTKTDEYKEKSKQTCQERYGADSYVQSDRWKERHDEIYDKLKQTCLENYGVDSYSKTKEFSDKIKSLQPRIRKKVKQTCQERYGADSYGQSDEYKERAGEIREKTIQTMNERYGVDNYNQTEEFREKYRKTCLEKYGETSYSKSEKHKQYIKDHHDEIQKKIYDTKKANGSLNSSSIENKFEQYLKDNNINYMSQYSSYLYPSRCDFYFPDKDIYLEINGHWTHGGHPYNSIDDKDKDKLELWIEQAKTSEFYKTAVEVWTIRDPKKVQTAKENGINLQVFYGCNLNKLIEFCKKNNIINL